MAKKQQKPTKRGAKIAKMTKPAQKPQSRPKSREMSKKEIALKNRQQYVNKEVTKAKKIVEKLRKQYGGDLNKMIKLRGDKKPRKVKTILNEQINFITSAQPELHDLLTKRVEASKGAYKPKSTNKQIKIADKTKARKGVRTLGQFHPWQRNDAFDILYTNDSFSLTIAKKKRNVAVTNVFGQDRNKATDKWLSTLDDMFLSLESTDVIYIKIDTDTGNVFAEVGRGDFDSISPDDL